MATSKENSKTESKNQSEIDDKELSDLLDSALQDFGNESQQKSNASGASASQSSAGDPISDQFTEDFSEEMAKQFEDAMKEFMSGDPEMLQQMENLAKAASGGPDEAGEFNDALKQTLSSLAQNTEGLQDQGAEGMPNQEDFMNMFSGMDPDNPDAGFMPMMQGMMKTLLSKDVLYPSLKEISDQYPDWLKNNKDKVSEQDYNNYSKQYSIIGDILKEFEQEKESDADAVKKQRFDKIMDLMQKMQELGQPPKEIVGDMAPGLEFDANGVPKFPGSPDACCVM